jgi:uncharacterized alkaline shock family protein YloU
MTHEGHTIESEHGSIRITGEALAGLVVAAAEQVGGATVRRPRRDLNVVVKDGRVHVKLTLAARFGAVLPALGEAVQRAVARAVGDATGLEVVGVDVAIEELDR